MAANTFLPTGDQHPGEAFRTWQTFSQQTPELPVGRIVNGGCTTELDEAVIATYDAPFPDESFKDDHHRQRGGDEDQRAVDGRSPEPLQASRPSCPGALPAKQRRR